MTTSASENTPQTDERHDTLVALAGRMREALARLDEMNENETCEDSDYALAIAEVADTARDIETKIDAYSFVRAKLLGEIEEIDQLLRPLNRRRQSIEKNLIRLKDVVESVVKTLPGQKIKTGLTAATYSTVKNNRTEIDDESLIPILTPTGQRTPYWRPQPDRLSVEAVKEALKLGHPVPGARLVDSERFSWR